VMIRFAAAQDGGSVVAVRSSLPLPFVASLLSLLGLREASGWVGGNATQRIRIWQNAANQSLALICIARAGRGELLPLVLRQQLYAVSEQLIRALAVLVLLPAFHPLLPVERDQAEHQPVRVERRPRRGGRTIERTWRELAVQVAQVVQDRGGGLRLGAEHDAA